MNSFRAIVIKTGIVAGVVFVISTYSPLNSLSAAWPLIAGAVAVWLVTRLPAEHRLLNGLGAAVVAGLIVGVTAFIGIYIVANFRIHVMHVRDPQRIPAGALTAGAIFAFAMIGVVDFTIAVVGGLLALPVRYFQLRRTHA
jgi:hypothetical protein